MLGALGALTNDANVSPLIPPYRECSAGPSPACGCAKAAVAAQGRCLALHPYHSPSPSRTNASHISMHICTTGA